MYFKFLIVMVMVAAALISGCGKAEVSVTASGSNAVAIGNVSGDVTINQSDKEGAASSASGSVVESGASIECGINNGALTITESGVEKPVACIGSKSANGDIPASATGKNAVAIGIQKGDVKIGR